MSVEFVVDDVPVHVSDERSSLLDALRGELGITSVKDGCSPQGQCGCCTVLVDGSPRVSCVTPVARVRGRSVTTVDGLDDADAWAAAFAATGASQCGFCTPGIIVRLSALDAPALADRASVDKALLAHLCRCTGWQTIREACVEVTARRDGNVTATRETDVVTGDGSLAMQRASLEGRVAQDVGPQVALGRGGFADDEAPSDALVALRDRAGAWVVATSLADARRLAERTQGRRTSAPATWPIDVPGGPWSLRLQTTWVEPAFLEPDASWCAPGGVPASPLGNGGAFGGKRVSELPDVARRLADEHGRPVRALATREDTVRFGPKRPPLAVGVDGSGRGVARLARPNDPDHERVLCEAIGVVAPGVDVEFVDVAGPPVSADLRGAGWAEIAAVVAVAVGSTDVTSPDGAVARAEIATDGSVAVSVRCGPPLDVTVARSYAIGAAHMALGMVRSESIALADDGWPLDLTIRSFGVLRAVDTPRIDVEIESWGADEPPVNGSDAVFAAVLAAAWRHAGSPARLPTAP